MLQLNPKIEFKEAKSIEEAEKYAKQNFKIKDFKVKDLEVANWINEGLTVLSNKFDGKVYMPREVIYGKSKIYDSAAYYRPFTDTLFINEINDKNFKISHISKLESIKMPLGNRFKEFCHDYKNLNNMSKIEKNNFEYTIANIIEILLKLSTQQKINNNLPNLFDNNVFGHIYTGKFPILFHEMGHVFERKSQTFVSSRNSYFAKVSKDIIMTELHYLITKSLLQKFLQEG